MQVKPNVSGKNFKSLTDRTKKTEKAELENKKALFFEIGLILSLCLVLLAFEWKSYETFIPFVESGSSKEVIEETVQITKIPLPEPKIPKPASNFKQVDNATKDVKEIVFTAEVKPNDINEPIPTIAPIPEIEVPEDPRFISVEEMPDFMGGDEARINFLRKNVIYPAQAREAGIQGTVYLSFVVEKNGEITDVQLLRGVGGGCDEEAIRVVKAMPKWKPGKQREKAVRVQLNLPIMFMLSN